MQMLDCHGDWLIDYADGALPQSRLAAAEEHLAECPVCRREVAALQTSGERLSDYLTMLRSPGTIARPVRRTGWTVVAQRASAVAAILMVITMGYWLTRQANIETRPLNVVQRDPAKSETANDHAPATGVDDIAAEIARETQIARLKAAITILKDEPGMSERSDSLQRYLSETYQVDYELPSM